jgi:uncharacterized protein (TIGR02186 family)
MSVGRLATIAGLTAWLGGVEPADAERLVTSVSTHQVKINSNFNGVDLTLFGAVEHDAASVGRVGEYALIVIVTGPREDAVTWRKQRVFGIWVNADSRTFVRAPSYLSVLTNRPLEAIATPDVLDRFRIGLRQFLLPQKVEGGNGDPALDDRFRRALVAVKSEQGLYREQSNAVTFLTPQLFRAVIPLPANVPVGEYEVETRLFADGVRLARETTAFEIVKGGFEQYIASSGREHGLLYGIATAMLALFTGWLAAVVFRRD